MSPRPRGTVPRWSATNPTLCPAGKGRADPWLPVSALAPPVYITGLGIGLPDRVLANEQIERGMPWLDTSADWIREHTGIRQRHVAAPTQQATDLGYTAAVEALQLARCPPETIDLVLLATNTAHLVYPAGAALIQDQFRTAAGKPAMLRATAFDMQQGCASFVGAIAVAAAMLRSGTCDRILVVGADIGTRMVDWSERNAVLLGDGAAACVMSRELPEPRGQVPALEVLATFMRTIPDRDSISQRGVLDTRNDPFQHMEYGASLPGRVCRDSLYARLATPESAAEQYRLFRMDGHKVYRFVRRTVPAIGYVEVMQRAGLVPKDLPADARGETLDAVAHQVDRFVPHGANMFLNQELADQMRIPYERMAITLQDYANTSAASVGLTLHRLLRREVRYGTIAKRDPQGNITVPERTIAVDPVRAGQVALLLSFGAGTSWNYVVTRAV